MILRIGAAPSAEASPLPVQEKIQHMKLAVRETKREGAHLYSTL